MALGFVLLAQRRFELLFFLGAPGAPFGFYAIALDGGQHAGGLLTAHHRNARIRPHPQETRRKRAATHAVVACAKAASDDDGELGHIGCRHRRDHLRAVPRDAFVFYFAADHEAGDVLQKHERDFAMTAQFDKVRAFLRRFAEQDAVVGDDAHWHAFDFCKACDQRIAKAGFEFVKLRAIHNAGDDLAHVKWLARIGRDHAVEFFRCKLRRYDFSSTLRSIYAG